MPLDWLVDACFHGDKSGVVSLLQRFGPLAAMELLNTPMSIGEEVFDEKCTALQLAILEGHTDLAEELLSNWPCDINRSEGCTFFAPGEENNVVGAGFIENISALWCAAYRGNYKVCEMLLDKGADINVRTAFGSTPLRVACLNGRLSTVQLLLARGADVMAAGRNGTLPIHAACWASNNSIPIIKELLDHAPDGYINIEDRNNETAAFIACGRSLETLRFLAEHGADLSIADRNGKTNLMRAAELGQNDVIEYLLQHPTQVVTAVTKSGKTALDFATEAGNKDIALMLLNAGASILNISDHHQTSNVAAAANRRQRKFSSKQDLLVRSLLVNLNLEEQPAKRAAKPRRCMSTGHSPRMCLIETCLICGAEPVDAVLLPCRHMCCCSLDAQLVKDEAGKCPLCKEAVENVIEVRRC